MIRKLVALGVLHGLLAGAPAPANAQAPTWNIDPVHSELTFRIRHFVTKVAGTFLDWTGVIRADPARLAEGTKSVTLEGEYTGVTGSGPGARIGFPASTRINRLDFGVSWNRAVEGGGLMLGDEVTIDIAIEALQK